MVRLVPVIALLLFCAAIAVGQDPITNKTDGLEITADQVVGPDEGFVLIEAKCAGPVEWVVVATDKVKYLVSDLEKAVIVSVPKTGSVSVYCVGIVDNKLTKPVRSIVTVQEQPPAPPTPPAPIVNPVPLGTKLFVTVVDVADPKKRAPETEAILNSLEIRQLLLGHVVHIYGSQDADVLGNKGLAQAAASVGYPAVVVVAGDGHVVTTQPMPRTKADFAALIRSLFTK